MNELTITSSLEKIFPDSKNIRKLENMSMLKNEKKAFQIVFYADKGETICLDVSSELLPYLRFFKVKMIKGGYDRDKNADGYYLKRKEYYPDLLEKINVSKFTADYSGMNSVWIQIGADSLPDGNHKISISNGKENCCININIINAFLPEQELIYTNWFHTDCLMSIYGFEAFSDEYWRVTENYLERAAEYGMNCVLTPLFTPPLDTKIGGQRPTVQLVDVKVEGVNRYSFSFEKLDKWIEMCERCNIRYYEMSHLFTQWGARHAPKIIAEKNGKKKQIFGWCTLASGPRYKSFIKQFASALTEYIDKKGIRSKCFLHISDEPASSMKFTYGKASKIVNKNFKNFKIIDALSSYELYSKGLIKMPIPATDAIEPFVGNVPELWTYYCGAQGRNYVSNRFLAMPSERNRILGFQLFKYNVKGFLHWGYNFYYSQYSKSVIDPFETTDAGGKFPSGDSFIVYPGKDGLPLDSLRLHVFYDAIQDLRALKLLESKIGYDKTLEIIEKEINKPLTFSEYPHDARWLEKVREEINKTISENI